MKIKTILFATIISSNFLFALSCGDNVIPEVKLLENKPNTTEIEVFTKDINIISEQDEQTVKVPLTDITNTSTEDKYITRIIPLCPEEDYIVRMEEENTYIKGCLVQNTNLFRFNIIKKEDKK